VSVINRLLTTLFLNQKFAPLRQLQLGLAAIIFAYAALSGQAFHLTAGTSDKLLHFLGNLLLIGSAWTAFYGRITHKITIISAVCYSMTIELLQYFTHTRHADIFDAVTNLCGLLIGYALCLLLEKYLNTLKTSQD